MVDRTTHRRWGGDTMKKSHVLLSCGLVVLLALPGVAHAFGDEIVVGFMVPLTKKGASYGVQSRAATEVAVEEINAAGGIGGGEVTHINKDTQRGKAVGHQLAPPLIGKEQGLPPPRPPRGGQARGRVPIL